MEIQNALNGSKETPKKQKMMYVLNLDKIRILWFGVFFLIICVLSFAFGFLTGQKNIIDDSKNIYTANSPRQKTDTLDRISEKKYVDYESELKKEIQKKVDDDPRASHTRTKTVNYLGEGENKEKSRKDTVTHKKTTDEDYPKTDEKKIPKIKVNRITPPKKSSPRKFSATKRNVSKNKVVRKSTKHIKTPKKQPKRTSPAKAEAKNADKQYDIQVAALRDVQKARSLRASLRSQKLSGYIAVDKARGKNWYKVRIGKFKSIETAKLTLKKLDSNKYKDAYITQN